MATEIVRRHAGELEAEDLGGAFAAFLRLNVAAGDAKPATVRAYKSRVANFYAWAHDSGISPGHATEDDVRAYRKALIDAGYSLATVASYLRAVKRFFDAAVWRGLRADNPAAGVKPPKDLTARADRVKYLPLAGLRELLDAPDPQSVKGRRDRAILALMGIHGLRVAEVAGLRVADLRLGEPAWANVKGKGGKLRQVYLIDSTRQRLEAWLSVRPTGAGKGYVFVTLDNRTRGRRIGTRNLRRMVDHYLEAVNLKEAGVSCHSLRHSAAIVDRLAANPAGKLAELLGL